jgi:hypothetical protein
VSKGKYSTRAINRAAAVDDEVITELRHKLQAEQQRCAKLEAQINAFEKSNSGGLMREAHRIAHEEISRLNAELADERQHHRTYLEQLAFDLLDLYAEHDCQVGEVGNVDEFNTEFARFFGMSDRFGELVDHVEHARESTPESGNKRSGRFHNRLARRSTSTNKKVRRVDAMLNDFQRNPGRFGIGVKPGQRLYYGRARGPESLEPPR